MKLRKRYWDMNFLCVWLRIKHVSKYKYVWLYYTFDTDRIDFTVGANSDVFHVEEKDVPEDIKGKMLEYVESEFFEIDLLKYIESRKK